MKASIRIELTGFGSGHVTDSALARFKDFGNDVKNHLKRQGSVNLESHDTQSCISVSEIGISDLQRVTGTLGYLIKRHRLEDEVRLERLRT
jgi:hypothetical protein